MVKKRDRHYIGWLIVASDKGSEGIELHLQYIQWLVYPIIETNSD
jgi:hypothetical protein